MQSHQYGCEYQTQINKCGSVNGPITELRSPNVSGWYGCLTMAPPTTAPSKERACANGRPACVVVVDPQCKSRLAPGLYRDDLSGKGCGPENVYDSVAGTLGHADSNLSLLSIARTDSPAPEMDAIRKPFPRAQMSKLGCA
eukprot:gene9238-biopygen8247